MNSPKPQVTQRQLQELREALERFPRWRCLVQDNPDPDALASAWALAFLAEHWNCQDVRVVFGGVIGRAENRAMCRYLRLRPEPVSEGCFSGKYGIAVVDSQPGTRRDILPEGFLPHIVFDHHPRKADLTGVSFVDVRPKYGATSTLVCQYLQRAEAAPSALLATGLMYGIKTDTMNLARGVSKWDLEAYQWLHEIADPQLLAKIEFARQPPVYYQNLVQAIANARVYNWLIVSNMGEVNNPDMAAEMADVLILCEGIRWVLCAGRYEDTLHLSLRADDESKNAGKVMERIVKGLGSGGGHAQMAGAQIKVQGLSVGQIDCILSDVVSRLLEVLNVDSKSPVPLVPEGELAQSLLHRPLSRMRL